MTGRAILGTASASIVLALAGCGGDSVNDLVSEQIGSPADCSTLGFAEIAGDRAKVYNCAFELDGGDASLCYSVIDGEAFRVTNRELAGCG